MLQTLGRQGVADMIGGHCQAAKRLADRLAHAPGVRIENDVLLNQLALTFGSDGDDDIRRDRATQAVCDRLNDTGRYFLRTATWNARTILRISVIGAGVSFTAMDGLADEIRGAWRDWIANPR
jgi:glutamate/tyrosine decarboxylase-like PLP-dependent enzyme